jgi:MFS family permease
VYQVSNSKALVAGHRRLLTRRRSGEGAEGVGVSRTVVLLGLTSLLTDISSEMVVTVLPLYLVAVGGFSPLAFGFIDGLYNGATALMGLVSGYIGDRFGRHKETAASGYGLSAICKLLLATIGTGVSAIGAVVLLDRAGKGIRTAPRDAMISLSTPRDQLGTAFGVHRAMDTTGAVLGPLVAFALLAASPLAFHSVFLVSFFIALLGVGVLVLFVDQKGPVADAEAPKRPPTLNGAFGLLRVPRYRALIIAGGLLSLVTASDAFVYLALQKQLDLGNSLFPLLFVGSSLAYMVLAVPMGRLADRFGRGRVLLAGYALLLTVYLVVLSPLGGWVLLALTLLLLGSYYAATDGVLMALGSPVIPEEMRGSGLALLSTVTSLSRMAASIAFGALWWTWSVNGAFLVFGIGLAVALAVAALLLTRSPEPAAEQAA